MEIEVLMLKQDDPSKCTAAKLVKFGLAKRAKRTGQDTLVLDPFAERTLLRDDAGSVRAVAAIDCSWELASRAFGRGFAGLPRRLPPLLAGNPVNFSKIGKLTTAESIAGALFIMGLDGQAHAILDKFKWGHTFFDLNGDLLRDYSSATTEKDVSKTAEEYGIVRSAVQ
ncbi:MAG: DUF367 family protein [Thaumarchaeota archaeon]|nr:DUF367 family protein [Nitrososphaerota archaeon]